MDMKPRTVEAIDRIFLPDLYSSVGPRFLPPILSQCPRSVTSKIYEILVAQVTMDEVRAAVSQLGVDKALGVDGMNGIFLSTSL